MPTVDSEPHRCRPIIATPACLSIRIGRNKPIVIRDSHVSAAAGERAAAGAGMTKRAPAPIVKLPIRCHTSGELVIVVEDGAVAADLTHIAAQSIIRRLQSTRPINPSVRSITSSFRKIQSGIRSLRASLPLKRRRICKSIHVFACPEGCLNSVCAATRRTRWSLRAARSSAAWA